MSFVRKLLLPAVVLCFALNIHAQQHYNSWFRATVSYPVKEKVKVDAELQHRRQSSVGNSSLFDNNLMYSFRIWLHYKLNKDFRLSIAPFACFTNYRIIQSDSDKLVSPNQELRFSVALDEQHKLGNRLYVINRTAVEYRLIEKDQPAVLRLRYRNGVRYKVTKKIELQVFDELFINTASGKMLHFFDQNRLVVAMDFKMSPALKLETTYLHINRLSGNADYLLKEHDFALSFILQFKNKHSVKKE